MTQSQHDAYNAYENVMPGEQNLYAESNSGIRAGFKVSGTCIKITVFLSICLIFLMAMLSGFVFRKIDACDPEKQIGDPTQPLTTTSTTTSSTITNSTSSPSTTTSSSTTTTTSLSTAATGTTITLTLPTLSTLSTTTTQSTASPIGSQVYDNVRLPDIYDPYNYELTIRVNFTPYGNPGESGFDGNVNINFNLKNASNFLLFHADQRLLILDPIIITNLNTSQQTIIPNKIDQHVKNEYYFVNLTSTLPKGTYRLSLSFKSSYTSIYGNRGMFAASYLDDGAVKSMVSTKFEPTDARKAFPCFDEPHLKATYDITVEHPIRTYALSNFPVMNVQNMSTYIRTKFSTTFKMSTYLAAWAVVPDDFAYEERKSSKNNLPIRVYGRKAAAEQGLLVYAANVAKGALDFYENEYFGISDAVPPKIDLIAVPDYPTGAMENWGLIGFRETRLLYSDSKNSPSEKQSVAFTIAHEISHFWFGNLVTCAWWNDLWLNEAMANFLEYKAVDKLFPDWKLDDQVIMLDIVPVMWDDALETSHPIETDVVTPDQINFVFDSITYSKGSSVLRMLESVVGETGFKQGLKNYLNNNKYSSGVAADFYRSLSLPSDMSSSTTPEKFMDTWLQQMNYPKVTITMERDFLQNTTKFKFEQSRFVFNERNPDVFPPFYESPFNYTWQIYMQCKAGGVLNINGDETQHLNGDDTDFTLFLDTKKGEKLFQNRLYTWIKCNPDFRSYYTTDYSPAIYDGIEAVLRLNSNKFSIGDRAYLIHVSYQLAFKGDKSYIVPAILSNYLKNGEKDYIPWRVFMYHINLISGILEHRPAFKELSYFAIDYFEKLRLDLDIYQQSNMVKPHLQSLLEANAFEFLCRLQEFKCLNRSSELFKKLPPVYFLEPNNVDNPIPRAIRASVYRYHLQNTYVYNDWFDVFGLYTISSDAQEKNNALIALTYTRSTWIIDYYLIETLQEDTKIRKQDFFSLLNTISQNPSGRHLSWYFYRGFWIDLVDKFGLQDRTFGRSIREITKTFETEFLLDDMVNFFYDHPFAGVGEYAREQAIEIVSNNILWVEKREKDIINNLIGPEKMKLI